MGHHAAVEEITTIFPLLFLRCGTAKRVAYTEPQKLTSYVPTQHEEVQYNISNDNIALSDEKNIKSASN